MTDSYARERREYVANIRKTFDDVSGELPMGRGKSGSSASFASADEEEQASGGDFFAFLKIRLFLAACLFGVFLYCHFTDTKIFDYSPSQMIELVSDNHYYTYLKNLR